jgi:hypothetical protein
MRYPQHAFKPFPAELFLESNPVGVRLKLSSAHHLREI